MAHCIKHTQCPECVKLGKDRSGNNLALYSDGSEYCFSCGYYRKADGMQAIRKAAPKTDKPIQLPFDSTIELPQPVWEWLRQYSLTELDEELTTKDPVTGEYLELCFKCQEISDNPEAVDDFYPEGSKQYVE